MMIKRSFDQTLEFSQIGFDQKFIIVQPVPGFFLMQKEQKKERKKITDNRSDSDGQPVLNQHRNKIETCIINRFPRSEWVGALRKKGYELIGQIGKGGYGAVYKAKCLDEQGKFCAIKVNFDTVPRSTIYFEVAFFDLVRKKSNLPRMIDFFFVFDSPHIVLEYFEHSPFIDILEKAENLTEVRHYVFEILKGVHILKNIGIYHRDIKPLNFLYNFNEKKGILIDFGLAQVDADFVSQVVSKKYEELKQKVPRKQWRSNQELLMRKQQMNIYKLLIKANLDLGISKIGTQSYVSLQTILGAEDQGHECEMWSVGVILLMFLTKKNHFFQEPKGISQAPYQAIFLMELAQLFGAQAIEERMKKLGWKVSFPKKMPKQGDLKKMIALRSANECQNLTSYDLLLSLLSLDPKERITVEQAIWHPFFDQIRQQHFRSEGEIKWYKKQIQKRNRNLLQEEQQQKSMSNFQPESSFSKNFRAAKSQEFSKQGESSESEIEDKNILQSKVKKPRQVRFEKESEGQDGSSQGVSETPSNRHAKPVKIKPTFEQIHFEQMLRDQSQSGSKQQKEPNKKDEIISDKKEYRGHKQAEENDRIDINMPRNSQKMSHKVKRGKATKIPIPGTRDKNLIKKEKRAQKERDELVNHIENEKKQFPLLDFRLQQMLKRQQARIKMQAMAALKPKTSSDECQS